MIGIDLLPSPLIEGVVIHGVLRLTNVGPLPCTNIRMEFETPRALRLEAGRRTVEVERLEPGAYHEHPVRVRPTAAGPMSVTVTYLSFRDGRGSAHYQDDLPLHIDVRSRPVVSVASLQEGQEGQEGQEVITERGTVGIPTVFISHRRSDSRYFVDHLAGRLREHLPHVHVFVDYDDMRPGEDFRKRLDMELAKCHVLLVLIGPAWLTAVSQATAVRRLDDEDDLVRYEVARGLARGVVVVPVLFEGATSPTGEHLPDEIRKLADRQAAEISRRHFDADVYELASLVEQALPKIGGP
jgi:TIR domain